jgi:hypothetical protein
MEKWLNLFHSLIKKKDINTLTVKGVKGYDKSLSFLTRTKVGELSLPRKSLVEQHLPSIIDKT